MMNGGRRLLRHRWPFSPIMGCGSSVGSPRNRHHGGLFLVAVLATLVILVVVTALFHCSLHSLDPSQATSSIAWTDKLARYRRVVLTGKVVIRIA